MSTREQGRDAEERVVCWMGDHGWKVLDRNFQIRAGEIDVIAEDGDERTLVFAEVRSRVSGPVWVSPLESITAAKRRKIELVARYYLMSYRGSAEAVRFDVFTWDAASIGWVKRAWG